MNQFRKGSMTAAELLAQLAIDPEYQAMRREKEAAAAARAVMLARDEAPMLQEFHEVGLKIDSVWDLVNSPGPYPEAIPVLVKHLEIEHHPWTKKGIVRALICPESRGIATDALVREFVMEQDSDSELKWLLGSALAESATRNNVSLLVDLVRDKRHGKGREYLPYGLLQLPQQDARSVLTELLEDPDTQDSAKKALSNLGR